MENVQVISPPVQRDGLKIRERMGYGFGDAGGTVITGLISNFLTFFYTDIFGLTPAIVGTIFVVLRIFDAITDPIVGVIADKTETKQGKFRPFILWTAVPLALICIMTFTVPDLSYGWKVFYAIVTYFGLSLLYTLNNVPYCALITRITDNPAEVISCQSYRFAISGVAGFAVSAGLPFLVTYFGEGDQALGYQIGVGILAFAAMLMILFCFFNTKEYIKTKTTKFDLKKNLKNIRQNDQLILTFIMSLLLITIFNTKGGAAMYFITYVLNEGGSYVSWFFGLATLGGIIGALILPYFTQRFKVRDIYFAINAILAVAHFVVYFVPGDNPTLWLGLVFICCVVFGFALPLHFTMVAFADEYGVLKTGVRTSGMNFAFNLFFIKLAWALSGLIISGVLVAVSYSAGAENQTPLSLQGISLLSTVIPGVLHLLLALTVKRFFVDKELLSRLAMKKLETGQAPI
ncbi:MFS transporter [Grimontia hollisae]|nr:MFS transporter [Grimontia hollisae]AMG31795.1 MFS transporter [Grimontia hollisae]STO44753.1 Inner membrane symporter yicJ [Grimontia hollisae]STQ75371.1 Inner membrane symporter yicJ [Grimontia hollisae]